MRSKGDTFKEKDVIILDTMGELSKMYSICDFAFIGGSFNKTGGHNPLEASVYSKPTITGPSIFIISVIFIGCLHVQMLEKSLKILKN